MTTKIHDNANYTIIVEDGKYAVVNVNTGVKEVTTESLPEAINAAEHSNAFLVNRLWEWISANGKESRAQMDEMIVPDIEVSGTLN